jgi:hypothetical protein
MRPFLRFACLISLVYCQMLRAEVVDRLAVTVGREVITELQLDEELRITALLNHRPILRDLEARRAAADRLVEQLLIKHEMNLSHYPLPDDADVAKYLETIRKDQDDRGAFDSVLRSYGLAESTLKQHLAWQLTTMRFVEYRFASDTAVSDADIETAYRRELTNWTETHHTNPPTLESARERIRLALAAEHTDAALNAWLAETRKQINILYLDKALQ